MRLFLAVPLADHVRDALAEMQTRLKETNADVRWVDPANFHLTVKFIGDQPEDYLPGFETVCERVAAVSSPFRLQIRGAGAFPKRGPLKTLWVGIDEGADAWKKLTRRLERPRDPTVVKPGGDLVPHITLGRVKSAEGMDALRAALAAEADTDCGAQTADRITLMQSTLDPRGAIYTPVREWPLMCQESST